MFRPGNIGHLGRLGLVAASRPGLVAQALAILAKYGSAANLYLPGVGAISGITAGNWLDSAGTVAATVDNPVGRVDNSRGEVNLTQSTAANRPILRRGLVNRLLWGGDFTHPLWVKSGSATATNPATVSMPTAPSSVAEFLTIEAPVGATATFACVLSGTGIITLGLARNGAGAYEDTIAKVTLPTTPALFLLTHTIRNAGQTGFIAFISRQTGDTAASVSCHGAALFSGAVTAQQIINAGGIPITTTAPASSANGPFSWQFDGTNDSFASTVLTGNEGWVCAGVTFGGAAAANETVFGSGAINDTDRGVWMLRSGGLGENHLRISVGNGAARATVLYTGAALRNTPRVVEGGWDALNAYVGVNGAITSAARTGTAGPSPTTGVIGNSSVFAHPLNGSMSAAIIMPTVLPTATERATLRQFIASLSGVTM